MMHEKLLNYDWLYGEYVEKQRSMQNIGDALKATKHSVQRALKKFDIPRRKRSSKFPLLNDAEWLRVKYIDEKLSTTQIAKIVGTTPGTINSHLKSKGIPIREVVEGLQTRYPDGRNGDLASNWKGGKRIMDGYVYIYVPEHPSARNGVVQEHRLIMEEFLGRPIEPNEVVHHKDGNRQNNDISNLVVKTRGRHVSEHFKASHEVLQMRVKNKALKDACQFALSYFEAGWEASVNHPGSHFADYVDTLKEALNESN